MKALGLIETIGLTAAIEAADTAVKSADVALVGYENTKGGGLITVKITGDVGAVKAAVDSAAAAASKLGGVYCVKVIPRPASSIEPMVYSDVAQRPPHSPKQQLSGKTHEILSPNAEPVPKDSGDPAEADEVMEVTPSEAHEVLEEITSKESEPSGEKPLAEETKKSSPRKKG